MQEQEVSTSARLQLVDVSERLRLHEALSALSIDGTFSAECLEQRYQVSLECAERFGLDITRRALDTFLPGACQTMTFVASDPCRFCCDTWSLYRRAGVAELRHQLGLPTDCWDIDPRPYRYKYIVPEAIWHIGSEDIAIDYDMSEGLEEQIEAATYYRDADYLRQIWGAPTEERRDELKAAIRAVDPTAQVIYAPYVPEPE